MMPLAEELEREMGFKFLKKEIWYNDKNKKEFVFLKYLGISSCNGLFIPVFYNKKDNKIICGEMSKVKLKEWIQKNLI